jgi:hypothetical protein
LTLEGRLSIQKRMSTIENTRLRRSALERAAMLAPSHAAAACAGPGSGNLNQE